MKKSALILMVVLFLSGCAIAPKGGAIRTAADRNVFEGLDKNSTFSISFPSPHSGPYESIDQFNFKIEEGKYKNKNASAIIGKSRKTEKWEVLIVMINESGEWIQLSKAD